jgi:hypothetical protein
MKGKDRARVRRKEAKFRWPKLLVAFFRPVGRDEAVISESLRTKRPENNRLEQLNRL